LASDAETSFSRQTTIKALPNDQSVISSPPALRGRTIVGVSNRTQSKTTSKAIHDTFEINEIPAVDAEVILLCYSISFILNLNNKPLFHQVLLGQINF
jgi:hypothetical protein